MPMVGHRGKCVKCRETVPPRRHTVERIHLYNGPDGERLCMKHHKQAWDEYLDDQD